MQGGGGGGGGGGGVGNAAKDILETFPESGGGSIDIVFSSKDCEANKDLGGGGEGGAGGGAAAGVLGGIYTDCCKPGSGVGIIGAAYISFG